MAGEFSAPGASELTCELALARRSSGMSASSAAGVGNLQHAVVADIDDGSGGLRLARVGGRELDAAQMAGAVEQAEFVADLADAEADVFGVGDGAAGFEGELCGV